MFQKGILLALLLLGTQTALAAPGARIALVLAAGGEPTTGLKKDVTMFDAALESMRTSLAGFDERWVFCDLRHAQTASLCQRLARGRPAAQFEEKGLIAAVSDLAARITEGTVSQLVIAIETHGVPKKPNALRHEIWADDSPLNLEVIGKLVEAAHERIPFAIIDNSCYGGNSLVDASSGACVVTQGGRNTVAFENVAPDANGRLLSIWRQLAPGVLLESAVLKLRGINANYSDSLWQLGTPAGLAVYDALETAVERVQFFPTEKIPIPLDDSQLQWIYSGFKSIKPVPGSPEYIDELGLRWADITDGHETPAQRELLELVRQAEGYYAKWIPTWEELMAAQSKTYYVRGATMTVSQPLLWLLLTPDAELGKYSLGEANVTAAHELRTSARWGDYPKLLADFQKGLPMISQWRATAGGPTLRERIRSAERRVYLELYAALARVKKDQPNPCASFKF